LSKVVTVKASQLSINIASRCIDSSVDSVVDRIVSGCIVNAGYGIVFSRFFQESALVSNGSLVSVQRFSELSQ